MNDSNNDDIASFHSDDVGEDDSLKSEELFVQRNDDIEVKEADISDDNSKELEIKEIFIGTKNDAITQQENETVNNIEDDVKVVNIDETKGSTMKNTLLDIKKKVKSSIYKKERFGDKVHGDRKTMSFF